MDLELTDEQGQLRAVAADLLGALSPLSRARSYLEGDGDPTALWAEMRDLGWYEVGVADGDLIGVPGLCVLAAELGRHAAPSLVIDTVVTTRILFEGGGEDTRARWREPCLEGDSPVTLAILEQGGSWRPEHARTVARSSVGGSFVLDGTKASVRHACHADAFAIAAATADGPGLFLLRADAPGIAVVPESPLDPSSDTHSLLLTDAPADPEDAIVGPGAAEAIERGIAVATVASAAEAVGAATRCLDMALQYATERRQFGRAIGSFQSLQHLLAEMYVLRETSWSTVLYAAACIDDGLDEAAAAVSIAKAHTARAAQTIAEGALQVFGGVGFTWEHDVHLAVRRALAAGRRFGDAICHERRIAEFITPQFHEEGRR